MSAIGFASDAVTRTPRARPAAYHPRTGVPSYDALTASGEIVAIARSYAGFAVIHQDVLATETSITVPAASDLVVIVNMRPGRFWTDLSGRPGWRHSRAGGATMIPAGLATRWIAAADGLATVKFCLAPALLARLLDEDAIAVTRDPFVCEPDPTLHRIARDAFREMSAPGVASGLLMESLAFAVIVRLARRPAARAANPVVSPLARRHLARVAEFIEANLSGPMDLSAMAAVCGLSVSQFARSFKAATGSSPYRYVTERRIGRAKELLVAGELTLADVADACGFGSQQQFTTTFRQVTGRPPGRWRRDVER